MEVNSSAMEKVTNHTNSDLSGLIGSTLPAPTTKTLAAVICCSYSKVSGLEGDNATTLHDCAFLMAHLQNEYFSYFL